MSEIGSEVGHRAPQSRDLRFACLVAVAILFALCAGCSASPSSPTAAAPPTVLPPTDTVAPATPTAAPTSLPTPTRSADVEGHLANARDFRAQGQYSLALIEVAQALTLDPSDAVTLQLAQELPPEATRAVPTVVAQATAASDFGRAQATVAVQVAVAAQIAPGAMGDTTCPNPVEIANPWCYNFVAGNRITNPPAIFCNFFNCVSRFADDQGYVVQCRDLTFSKQGGTSASCADHGGESRVLFGP